MITVHYKHTYISVNKIFTIFKQYVVRYALLAVGVAQ
jgi:hypothetical protein